MIIIPLRSLVAKKLPGAPYQMVCGWSPTKEYRNSLDEAVQLTLYGEVLHRAGAVGRQTSWLVRNEKTQTSSWPNKHWQKKRVCKANHRIGNADGYEKESLAQVAISGRLSWPTRYRFIFEQSFKALS